MKDHMVGVHITDKNTKNIFDILFSESIRSRYKKFISVDVLLCTYSIDKDDYDEMFDKFCAVEYFEIPEEKYAFEYNLDECTAIRKVFGYNSPMLFYFLPDNETDKIFCNRKWELTVFDYEHVFTEMYGELKVIEDILSEMEIKDFSSIPYPGNISDGFHINV